MPSIVRVLGRTTSFSTEHPAVNTYNHKVLIRSINGAASTIIDGSAYLSQDSVLEGFSFTGGNDYSVDAYGSTTSPITVRLLNCVFFGNQDYEVLYAYGANLAAIDCTSLNSTIAGYSALYNYRGTTTLENCILWDGGNEISSGQTGITATYCDIQGASVYPGTGNINANPLLRSDGHLTAGSPCIGAGTATGAPNLDMDNESRPQGGGYDIGADQYVDSQNIGIPDWWQIKYFHGLISAGRVTVNGATAAEDYQYQIDPASTNTLGRVFKMKKVEV